MCGLRLHPLADVCRVSRPYSDGVRHRGFELIAEKMLVGLDLLTIALVVVALTMPAGPGWVVWLVAVVFLAIYSVGRHRVSVVRRPLDGRGGWWPAQAWAVALLGGYVGMLLASTGAMWLAFPLMLLELHVLGPRRGVFAVGATTVLAILLGAMFRGAQGVGYVLGPLLGAVVAVGVVVALESLTKVVADKDAALEDLQRTREQLAALESERAVATERARLARDIHDTLAQDFSAIGLQLRAVAAQLPEDAPAMAALRAAQETAVDGLSAARRFVGELGRDEAHVSLESTLGRVVAKAVAVGGPSIDFRVSGDSRVLPTEVATALVRVAQSALANVVQHAHARTAEVHLAYEEQVVVLDVVDDGIGFDPAATVDRDPSTGGFGVPAMRARAAELGGTLTIESGPGDGTAVAMALPTSEAA